jgi:hypothetical protein
MKKQTKTAAALLGITLALSLSGCAGGAVGPKKYQTVDEMKADFEASGRSCDMWWEDDPTFPGYKATANCASNATFQIYPDGFDVAAEINRSAEEERANDGTPTFIYGPNWSINFGDVDGIQSLGDFLKGTVVNG